MAKRPSRVSSLFCHHLGPCHMVPPLHYGSHLLTGLPPSTFTLTDILHRQPEGTSS